MKNESRLLTQRIGVIYVTCKKRNLYCSLVDATNGKVLTSCSLRVPKYENKYNERENLYIRGLLLGNLFAERVQKLNYSEVFLFLTGKSRSSSGLLRSFEENASLKIISITLSTNKPHNGCRPEKVRRVKLRSKKSK
uniref:ribosomal protein S11 n=1 Tax=Scytothamnus australis TaxID=66621 RepID=UPI002E798C65|nr:ribosomal protein S11 [Scytothamnus australis]WBP70304.1 ribosomal protein S11 [Scytothamnus australis]